MNMLSSLTERRTAPRLQIFVSDLSATGVVRNAVAIANQAAASGYEVRMLTCQPDGVLRGEVHANVAVVPLIGSKWAGKARRRQMQRAWLAYRRHIRAWRPHMMLSAGNHGHLLSSLAWAGLPGRKVLRISNDITHSNPSAATKAWRWTRLRLMAWLADHLVLVSEAQMSHPLFAAEIDRGRASIIPNGVDLAAVRAAAQEPCGHPWVTDSQVPLVLFVGRTVRQKNLDRLIAAFAAARKQRAMRLMLLGDGPKAEVERLRQFARTLGVEEDISFVPPVSNPFPFVKAARTLVLPSLWEGSANVLLEAMACGTPVLASRTAGDATGVLANGRHGVMVDPHDVATIAKGLLRQTGPTPVVPGQRAEQFERSVAMRRYLGLFQELRGSTQADDLSERGGRDAKSDRFRSLPT